MFEDQVALKPQAVAVQSPQGDWTYAQLGEQVARMSAWLRVQGVARGDRVAILSENRREFVLTLLAAAKVGAIVACIGDSTITVNLYKNGSTVLSAPVVLDNSNTAFAIEAGAISSASYSADDVFEVVVSVSAGTGTLGQGLFVSPMFREACG